MASLTPLSKGLIALAVVGGMASAVWHLVLKERLGAPAAPASPASVSVPAPAVTSGTPDASPAAPPMTPPPVTPPPETRPAAPPPAVVGAQAPRLSAAENAEMGRKLLASGDPAQARVHLEQAVKDGDGSAACLLGEMTLKGQGGIRADRDEAARLFQLAQSRNIICFASGK